MLKRWTGLSPTPPPRASLQAARQATRRSLSRWSPVPATPPPSLLRQWAAAIGLALLIWGTSCRHTYQHHQTAQRTEQETRTFQTATSAEDNKQSVETKKSDGKKVTERFRPDGSLMERVSEQWQSDGRVTTETASASRSTAAGGASRSVAASSSSTKQADTRAGWSPWWWLMAIPAAALVWVLRRRVLPFIPWA